METDIRSNVDQRNPFELFTWQKKPRSLRGRKPVAISQPVGIDCFVVLLLAMTQVSHPDSLVTAQFRFRFYLNWNSGDGISPGKRIG